MRTVVVLTGGPELPVLGELPAGAMVIAADGGAELGGPIDLLVGDLDSISAETLARIEHVERHPVEKDATDLELALDAALRLRAGADPRRRRRGRAPRPSLRVAAASRRRLPTPTSRSMRSSARPRCT